MSCQIELVPELQQLFDDFVSVRQRFSDLAKTYLQQQMLLQTQETELENLKKEFSAMKRKEMEDANILKSYNQLKLDYDLLNSATEKHRMEICTENKKHVQELEDQLKAARAKSLQQAQSHQSSVTQIVAEYEAKLRDADEKIRQLNRYRSDTTPFNVVKNTENHSSFIQSTKTLRGNNKRWVPLAVEIKSRGSASRARGRSRGGASKRKLFVLENDRPIDVFE